jgi:hypothetical protein
VTAQLVDQSWLRGTTVITASSGVATFTDLAVSRANSYPPGYPDPTAGVGGVFLLQFTVRDLVAVAGVRLTQHSGGCLAMPPHTTAADLEFFHCTPSQGGTRLCPHRQPKHSAHRPNSLQCLR